MSDAYDVAVAGGGPAGAATALRLARAGHTVALLERTTFNQPRVGETFAPSIQPLLRDLGVWPEFVAAGHLPSWGTQSLWSEPATHSHLMSGYDSGWHVDRRTFDQMLFNAAATAGASVFPGTSLTTCRYTGDDSTGTWHLTCSTGLHLTARVLIDATGRQATVARSLGARRIPFDHLVGITARYPDRDTTNEHYLLIEPTPLGWWYTAPLPHNHLIAMLITDTDLCRHHHLSTPAAYHSHQSQAPTTASRLALDPHRSTDGTSSPRAHPPPPGDPSRPRIYSAASHRVIRPDDPRPWLTVGDAALAVDPISGSGVPRALRTAESAAQTTIALLTHPAQAASLVDAYESARNAECTTYLTTRAAYYAAATPHSTPFWTRRR